MLQLNADQARNFFTTLEHVDKLLFESEHALKYSGAPSVLHEYICDITPEQRNKLLEKISIFRDEVKTILLEQEMTPQKSLKSAARTVLTNLLFADMSLEEIDSHNMDHGKLTDETASQLDILVSRMRFLIQEMASCLRPKTEISP